MILLELELALVDELVTYNSCILSTSFQTSLVTVLQRKTSVGHLLNIHL